MSLLALIPAVDFKQILLSACHNNWVSTATRKLGDSIFGNRMTVLPYKVTAICDDGGGNNAIFKR